MIYVMSLIAYATCFLIAHFQTNAYDASGWRTAGFIIGGLFLLIAIIIQLCTYYAQAEAFETIEEKRKNKKTYQDEADQLIGEFKIYLADQYPEHEKMIFEQIKPENVTAFAIKYPEIKTNETLAKLCGLIENKVSKIYKQDRDINQQERFIAVRKRTIMLTVFPILPKK